jgi:Integrase core domain
MSETWARWVGSVEAAQATLDRWVAEYNADRPHQALDGQVPVTPAERLTPVPPAQRDLIELWLPPTLTLASGASGPAQPTAPGGPPPPPARWHRGPIEFGRVVHPSGNMWVAGRQYWLGPARAGTVIRFWADCQLIHLSAGGARIKTVRSHLCVARPGQARRQRGRPRRPVAAAADRGRPGDPGRTATPPRRPGLARWPPPARRGDPQRPAGRHPH